LFKYILSSRELPVFKLEIAYTYPYKNPKSFSASLDLKRGVGFVEKVFFFEAGSDIYI
jgi:hypothetical protein